MPDPLPVCRAVTVLAFRGTRSSEVLARLLQQVDDARHGRGHGPTYEGCLRFAGHAGISTDDDSNIYGFNPDTGDLPAWQALDRLKNGDAFPGVVRNDKPVFASARTLGISVLSVEVILPAPAFRTLKRRLDGERKKSHYAYGFPNGDGDCNCITWLERLGLPLLTGRMDEFVRFGGVVEVPSRRFGRCV